MTPDDPPRLCSAATTLAILALLAVGCDAGADPDHDRPPTVPILEVPILEGPGSHAGPAGLG